MHFARKSAFLAETLKNSSALCECNANHHPQRPSCRFESCRNHRPLLAKPAGLEPKGGAELLASRYGLAGPWFAWCGHVQDRRTKLVRRSWSGAEAKMDYREACDLRRARSPVTLLDKCRHPSQMAPADRLATRESKRIHNCLGAN